MTNIFSWERFWNIIPKLTPYLLITFQIVLVGLLFGTLLGIIVAILRLKKIPVIHQILSVYISFMRGTSMLLQMMVIYYGLPSLFEQIGININDLDKLIFVYLTFVLNLGAFLGEEFRAAILAVSKEQTEAGYSIGLTAKQTFLRIVLPQAFIIALPSYGAEAIGCFHLTSIAFKLGVVDFLGRANTLGAASGHQLESYLFIAIVYISFSLLLRFIFVLLEKKYSFGKKGATA